ncbi:MAG: hypothetical protein EZS28_021881 [Streblomastix strix]|uniref:non-specific serine/threonine protein kinase n=1 Tax=Streblomastix strix TaxID=222440 RepID=A0A5J4VK44_9EUKA|nr:MAG: hypothetical protein EZS28_021881 [Streblomastix strix]
MFSFGVIIFQLITGHHPYEADPQEAMIDKIKKNKVSELPDWVSNQMKEVISWMMNNNENHRPTTKMILSHDTVSMYLRFFEKRNRIQSDNERALAERDRERTEKERFKQEKDQQKRRADKTQSELDKQKTKTNESQELVRAFQQQVEATQSDVIRLTTEIQHLKAELTKLRPQTISSKQQSKAEPNHQQIQRSVPPSLNPNMLVGLIPNKEHAYLEGPKIIHTNNLSDSTVAFNPIIPNGIVRFGGFFEDPSTIPYFSIGIADSSAVFGSDKSPDEGENEKKTVCYWSGQHSWKIKADIKQEIVTVTEFAALQRSSDEMMNIFDLGDQEPGIGMSRSEWIGEIESERKISYGGVSYDRRSIYTVNTTDVSS